jgi:hypothetical protein
MIAGSAAIIRWTSNRSTVMPLSCHCLDHRLPAASAGRQRSPGSQENQVTVVAGSA